MQESSSQTELKSFEEGTQTNSNKDSGIQTEEIVKNLNSDYNVDNLAAFLKRISPDVLLELNKAEKSKAFTQYRDISDEQQFHNTIKATHIIQSAEVPKIPEVKVSSLSWSCTGNVISFGYETFEHEDWCTHKSSVDFYNITMSDFDEKKPRHAISTTSCVTYLATHPFEPTIIAIGTADGDVHIWDLKKVDRDVSIGNIFHHKDRITRLSWETINSQLYLVSSALDGNLFLLKVVPSIGSVVISERYIMTNEGTELLPGINTYGFSTQPGVFVVALESGELLHCSTFSAPTIPSTSFKNPVLKSIAEKTALVTDLKFSPFIEHLFIICCVNKTFLIYSLKESVHLYRMHINFIPLGLAWSRNQGNIFFLWGQSQKVHVFNSDNGRAVAELQSDISNYDTINSVAVSPKSSRLGLSIGNGRVLIWEIPEFFIT
nr:WD repeat-containing protein 34-like isoform X2 [Halyomorpha halys]